MMPSVRDRPGDCPKAIRAEAADRQPCVHSHLSFQSAGILTALGAVAEQRLPASRVPRSAGGEGLPAITVERSGETVHGAFSFLAGAGAVRCVFSSARELLAFTQFRVIHSPSPRPRRPGSLDLGFAVDGFRHRLTHSMALRGKATWNRKPAIESSRVSARAVDAVRALPGETRGHPWR